MYFPPRGGEGPSMSILGISVSFLFYFATTVYTQTAHMQHAKIGVLVDLHEPGTATKKSSCGPLNIHAYQKLKAIEWAVEIINNKSWPGEFYLDVAVHDTCGESGIALSETVKMLNSSKANPETPLIGLIVIGSRNNERIIDRPLESLNNENISAIVTSARAAGLVLSKHPNVFTTAPDLSSVTEGIVALINQLGASSSAIISSSPQTIKRFQRIATSKSIHADKSLLFDKDTLPMLKDVIHFIKNDSANVQSMVLMLESIELESLVSDGDTQSLTEFQNLVGQKAWILGSVGMDNELIKDWSSKFNSNLLVMQPRASVNSDFHSFFVDKLRNSLKEGDGQKDALEFMEAMYHCQGGMSLGKKYPNPLLPSCTNLTRSYMISKLHPESDIGFIVNAVSAYSASLRLAQLACTNETTSKCNHSKLSAEVLQALRSLNLPVKDVDPELDATESTVSTSHELEGTQRRINYHGKLISRKYDLLISRANGKLSQIGQYSHEEGLVLDVMLGVKFEGGTSMQDGNGNELSKSSAIPSSKISMRRGKTAKSGSGRESQEYLRQVDVVNMRRMMSPPELYISRVWAMVATATAITGVFISLYMLVYVLQRMCDGTLRGNQVLGILLLLGIIMMYASVVLFVLPPGTLLCNLRVFVPSIATAICFGILMLKAMQLRSLVALGLGGRVPALNQFITLVFIVAVQIAVDIQWFFSPHGQLNEEVMSGAASQSPLIQDCFYSHKAYLYLHGYLGVLILIVFLYGTSVLKIRRNYNEAKWITLAACLSLPIAVAWAVVVHTGPSNFQEPASCVAFIAVATVLLFSIFIPKLNTISQQSKWGKRKQTLKSGPPGYNSGSISTIFTTLSDRGTLQSHISQKRHGHGHSQANANSNSSHPYAAPTPGSARHPHNYSGGGGGGNNFNHSHNPYIPPAPLMPSANGKSVTYSPRLTTNFYHSSSAATSLARSNSMKTPFFDSNRAAYP